MKNIEMLIAVLPCWLKISDLIRKLKLSNTLELLNIMVFILTYNSNIRFFTIILNFLRHFIEVL